MEETFKGKFKKYAHYGFIIPDERDHFWGDFYVSSVNIEGYEDGDNVEARILTKQKGKKPEAKIMRKLGGVQKVEAPKIVEWVYSGWDGNFWFVDVPWIEKWFFVFGKYKNGAKDGDAVKAEIISFNWKKEAKILEVLLSEKEILEWIFTDNDKFWFVKPNDKSEDIFIAGSRKNGAKTGDTVKVQIIRMWVRRREWVIVL